MKDKIFGVLQRVGRSFMLPIAILPVAGLLLGIGSSFTNETSIATYGLTAILGKGTILNSLLIIMNQVGSAVFNNLPLIFAVGVAIGMAYKEKEVSALSALIAFFVMNTAINAMLQAVGRADIPMKIILAGGLIKLGLNVILVLQPRINIMGSAYSTLVCYVFMVTASLFSLKKATGVRLRIGRVFLRPLTAALCCGAAAWAANGLLGRVISVKAATVAAIGLAALVYLAVLLLVRAFTKEDILSLPKGEKIAQTLEKRGWIG